MANKLSSTNEVKEEKLDRTIHPPPVFWIPFVIAGVVLVVVGSFRFSEKTDNIYFIYICLIAFAIAAFPWVRSIKLKGIFEIDRAIDNVREEARDRVDQASKRFDDRLLSLRTELVSQLSSIQSQVVQQTSLQMSRQNQIFQFGLVGLESVEMSEDALKKTNTGELKIKLPSSSELPEKYSELRIGFVKATATALNDPFGFKCGRLLHQIPETGQSSKKFEEARIMSNVTYEQVRTMKTLGLITKKESVSGEPDEAIISISELGRIYTDYWNVLLQKIDLNKIASATLKIIPWLARILI